MSLRTVGLDVTLAKGNTNNDALAEEFDKKLNEIETNKGEVIAYTQTSDYTNQIGSRFVTFLVTYEEDEDWSEPS